MDLDNKNESEEFDLNDILSEFHDLPGDEAGEVEPDAELEALLKLPELDIAPVVVKEPELDMPSAAEVPAASAAEEAASAAPEAEPAEDAAVSAEAPASDATVVFIPAPEEGEKPATTDQNTVPLGDAIEPTQAEPAFEVAEEFIPSPIVFTPRSRLKQLRKKLVAGPEKRYYELSEMGVGKLQIAILLSLVIVALCAGVTTLFTLDMVPANRLRLVIFSQVLAMLVSALMGSNLMLDSLGDLLKGRFTVNTLLTITFAACCVDAVLCLRDLRVPCCAAFSLEMTMALWARYQRHNSEMAQMDTLRKAVRLHGITRVEKFYHNADGLLQTEGEVEDFMENYDKTSAPELIQNIYAVIALFASIAIAVFTGMLHGMELGVQVLSTCLLVAVPASFFVSITRPMAILEQRLHMVGSLICGWQGVKGLTGKVAYPLRDQDLFPQGSTKLNGVKFYGTRSPDETIAFSTALICAAGGGLVSVFKQLLQSRDGLEHTVENFHDYGGGGIGGEVCGEPVLLGSLNFMQDMNVKIPEGTMVSQAVYAAIDGQLCAVYAISYAKMRSATAGLVTLSGYRKLIPIMLCGDFMLTEDFIHAKFGVKTRRIVFPNQEERAELLKRQPNPEEPVLALSTREELVSPAYAVTGARSLATATKLGVLIHLIGGIIGMLIMLVLGYLGSTELLTPTNVLLYQLVWAIPGLLVTEWMRTV